MVSLLHIHRRDIGNVGDMCSNPFAYFRARGCCVTTHDIETIDPETIDTHSVVVIGGGGLIDCLNSWNSKLTAILSRSGPTIGWGVGLNTHYGTEIARTLDLSRFALLGLRDKVPGIDWVPCPSCAMSLFDDMYDIQRDIGVFWHKNMKFDNELRRFERQSNRCTSDEAIRFIATSRVIITNSYHGMYWSVLLKRRVLLHRQFSTKFNQIPFDVPTYTLASIVKKYAGEYDDALRICRQRNIDFAYQINTHLSRYNVEVVAPS